MHDDARRDAIKQALDAARTAREQARPTDREAALVQAREHAEALGDGPLLAATCWRLAKARHDAGQPGVDTALAPLVDQTIEERGVWGIKHQVNAFTHYPQGLRALPRLTSSHRDRHGYGPGPLDTLWQAAIALHEDAGDPFLAAQGRQLQAWQMACTGRVADVLALHLAAQRLDPARFGEGPHRHPSAPDCPSSVFWVQRDLARTSLRACTWSPDASQHERSAYLAAEALEDAMEDTGATRADDPWFLDAMLHAALRFGWRKVRTTYAAALPTAADALDHPVHTPRLHGLYAILCGEDPTGPFRRAAHAARAPQAWPGPEWTTLALLGAGETDAARATADLASLVMHDAVFQSAAG